MAAKFASHSRENRMPPAICTLSPYLKSNLTLPSLKWGKPRSRRVGPLAHEKTKCHYQFLHPLTLLKFQNWNRPSLKLGNIANSADLDEVALDLHCLPPSVFEFLVWHTLDENIFFWLNFEDTNLGVCFSGTSRLNKIANDDPSGHWWHLRALRN